MSAPNELRFIVDQLTSPPFSKLNGIISTLTSITPIQLHDDLPLISLLQVVTDVMAFIDDANSQPGGSLHRGVDLRQEQYEETAARMGDFLRMLKCKSAINREEFIKGIMDGDRGLILSVLYFLLKDYQIHKKRAYLAPYLASIEIPPEYTQDDLILDLQNSVENLQNEFKESHKYLDSLRNSGNTAGQLKREIQQMEEEKQQVLNKIAKIRRKVEDIPNHEVWLEAAKNLRMEQQKETLISEKTKDQRFQLSNAEKKLNSVQQSLKDAKAAFSNAGPDTLYNNMEKEHKMNKYLVSENLPKLIQDGKSQSKELTKILSQPASSNKDLAVFEKEIKELNEEIAMLAEKRLLLNNSGEDKLALFRQQAAIIARKKEGKAQRLAALHEEINSLTVELEKKKESSKNSGVKIMKGEEFKKYVNDLRGKSTVYKRKKAEISEIIAEFGILQRTEEILKGREKAIQLKIQELEKKSGVSGFHAAQDNLEKVSERKGELDQVKGKTLSEISEIVQNLMKSINDKKTKLSPIIQELRTIRQAVQELESAYSEKKKQYDATMVGLDSDNIQLEQEVKGYRQDIINDQSRYHYLQQMCHVVDIAQDKIFHEIKAYIGGDDSMEAIQKQRGFKSYRDLYNKKITEQENLGKNLREQQKDVRTNFEPNVKQLAMFSDLEKLLALKLSCNKKVLAAGRTNNTDIQGAITQERLVL